MIWVYAICDRPDLPVDPPLESVRVGDLVAVFARRVEDPAGSPLDALWEHERVVERLMADRTVLPMRFGTRFGALDGLTAAIEARRSDLYARIDRVRGRVEIGVRVVVAGGESDGAPEAAPTPAGSAPPSGRDYLLAKLGGVRAARDAGDRLHAPLAERAIESLRSRPTSGEMLSAAYLIEHDDVDVFVATVERMRGAHPDLEVLCTGPWPAYSFADA